MIDSFEQIHANYVNGNIADYRRQLKSLVLYEHMGEYIRWRADNDEITARTLAQELKYI